MLNNRIAIVTGAAAGIGYGIAQEFLRRGAKVIIADADASAGATALKSLQSNGYDVTFSHADVTDDDSVAAMVQVAVSTYGGLDIVVNNVGITLRQSFDELTVTEWNRIVDINLTGMLRCVRAAKPHLNRSEHASILNIASVNAYQTIKGMGAYPATKAGVVGLTRSLALDLAPHIRVNAIAPGVILTDTWARQIKDLDAAIENRLRYIPRKRVGTPTDVGKAAAFLVSDDADFITGTVLRVDGGQLSQLYAEE